MTDDERDFGFPRRQGRVARSGGARRNLQVIMLEDLYAAVDSLRDPSFAMAVVLVKKRNGDLKKSKRKIKIVNRCENISVDKGSYGKAEEIDQEWQLYVADCPGGSSSNSSDSFTRVPLG